MAGVGRMAHWVIRGCCHLGRMETGSETGVERGEEEGEGSAGQASLVQHLADSRCASVFAVVVVVVS